MNSGRTFPGSAADSAALDIDQPYPLSRHFRRRILPAFFVLILLIPGLAAWGGADLVSAIYLQQAERRAETINRAVAAEAETAWRELKATRTPKNIFASPGGEKLIKALGNEVKELGLAHLKVYGSGGIILFNTDPGQIGTADASAAYELAMKKGERSAILKTLPDGTELYELYVRLDARDGHPPVVLELYEPTSHLDQLIFGAAAPVAAAAALTLGVIAWALLRLVGRAQADIDKRTALLATLKERLAGLVSVRAVSAAKAALSSGQMPSERVELTLFYSDVRGFTAMSEANPPEEVVRYLNRMMSLQIAAISAEGGDVDKMIGDAVLARFDGGGRQARAVRAAIKVQRDIAETGLEPGVGIGIFSGPAISGVIGAAERMDFTVIGDSVNSAARLCSAAMSGEIVVDEATAAVGGDNNFGIVETISVKGRQQTLRVRRWQPSGN
ncbi:MAG: adenylate/guanylate cyclase domain-containing protein [Proteobacteria bacterium]|nr:adenylate/guanylate cyclase domain-containing protein [Pseudomonadota bacterium]